MPQGGDVGCQFSDGLALCLGQVRWLAMRESIIILQDLLNLAEGLFPMTLQCMRHEPVFRFDRVILAFGALDW